MGKGRYEEEAEGSLLLTWRSWGLGSVQEAEETCLGGIQEECRSLSAVTETKYGGDCHLVIW